MSNEPQEKDSRHALYDRFVLDLDSSNGQFYDEDDLVEIYDYAGDIGDRRVALEVLIVGARLYPSSVPLAERKAIFYMTYDEEGARKAIDALPSDNVIGRLLKLRLDPIDKAEATTVLDSIISTAVSLTDEEILQLTDTVADLNLDKWLSDNKSRIAALTDYPQTLYYEMMQMSLEASAPDDALATLEELTMMEPFSIDFWLAEAQVYAVQKRDPAKALAALDYALAIDPENAGALMLKAQCYNDLHYPHEQIMPLLEQVIATYPDLDAPYLAQALLLSENNRDQAIECLDRFMRYHSGSQQGLEVLISTADGQADQVLIERELRTNYGRAYLTDFLDTAGRYRDEGKHGAAGQLLLALQHVYGIPEEFDMLMEELFRSGRAAEAVTIYEDNIGVLMTGGQRKDRFATFFYILSRIKIGRTEDLVDLVDKMILSVPIEDMSLEERLAQNGLVKQLLRIRSFLTSPTPDRSLLDPFIV